MERQDRLVDIEIRSGALKHGVTAEDIRHAARMAIVAVRQDDEYEGRTLVLGPDRAGRMLELVAQAWDTDDIRIIHAMPMRPRWRRLIPR